MWPVVWGVELWKEAGSQNSCPNTEFLKVPLTFLHVWITEAFPFLTVCLLSLRMSSNTGSTAGGMCGTHQSAKERRSASGFPNKGRHHRPAQGHAQQEPHCPYSECVTYPSHRNPDSSLFIPRKCLLENFPPPGERAWAGRPSLTDTIRAIKFRGCLTNYLINCRRHNKPSLNGLGCIYPTAFYVWYLRRLVVQMKAFFHWFPDESEMLML